MNKNAIVILAEGFEEIEAVTPIDLMRRAGITVSVTGLGAIEVKGSHAITVKTDSVFSIPFELPDAMILPGGPGHENLLRSNAVLDFVKKMFAADKLCAAICAAPTVLGKSGILGNMQFTCFPGHEQKIPEGIFTDLPVVVDRNVITGKSAGTAVPFSLQIIAYLLGTAAADKTARSIIYK
jgi:protein deglycase